MAPQVAERALLCGALLIVQTAFCSAEEPKKCISGTQFASLSPVVPSVSLEYAESEAGASGSFETKFCAYSGEGCAEVPDVGAALQRCL